MRGLISIIIAIAIIAFLVFGYNRQNSKNQIESGQDAIDQAKDAQQKQSDYDFYLQNQVQDPPSVNYHGVLDNLKK